MHQQRTGAPEPAAASTGDPQGAQQGMNRVMPAPLTSSEGLAHQATAASASLPTAESSEAFTTGTTEHSRGAASSAADMTATANGVSEGGSSNAKKVVVVSAAAGDDASALKAAAAKGVAVTTGTGTDADFADLEEGHVPARSQKSMNADIQTDRLWLVYKPFLHWKTVVVFFSALMLIWLFSWVYIGATWDPLSYAHSMEVYVTDCDGGVSDATIAVLPPSLRPYASSLAAQPLGGRLLGGSIWDPQSAASGALKWVNYTCSAGCTPGCRAEVIRQLDKGRAWAAVWVPPPTSTMHLAWALNLPPNVTLLPDQVAPSPPYLEYLFSRGRSYTTYSFINKIAEAVFQQVFTTFGVSLATSPLAAAGALRPVGLVTPLTLEETDLNPVAFFGQNLATYVFCILVWLGSAFSVGVSAQYKMREEVQALNAVTPKERPHWAALLQALLVKTVCSLAFTFLLVVLLTCVVWALGRGEEDWDLNAGQAIAFMWYLSWSYVAFNSVLLHAMGPDRFNSLSAFVLILQLMSSGGIVAEQMSPPFFHIGRGLPFYYGTRGLRTIFFGSEQGLMWINWLVLTAWNVLAGGLALAYVTWRIHRSGTTARPVMVAANTVGELMLVGAGL